MKSYRDTPDYKIYFQRYLHATSIIYDLQVYQTNTRLILKYETDPEERKRLRKILMDNRRGPNGLRSLNKQIRKFYLYCEKHR